MTAPHIVDPHGLLSHALGEASPDLMRDLLQNTINMLLSADADLDLHSETVRRLVQEHHPVTYRRWSQKPVAGPAEVARRREAGRPSMRSRGAWAAREQLCAPRSSASAARR